MAHGWGRLLGCRAKAHGSPSWGQPLQCPVLSFTCTGGGSGLPGARWVPSPTVPPKTSSLHPHTQFQPACRSLFWRQCRARSAQKAGGQVGRRAGGRQAGEDKFISARASGEWACSLSLPYSHHLILNLDKLDLALKAT